MSTAYLVTGTTRGIGRALADVVLDANDRLFSLSSAPDSSSRGWRNFQCDLSCPEQVLKCGAKLVDAMVESAPEAIVLINNAAILDPMRALDTANARQIVRHLHVNQAAPALLMAIFISRTSHFRGKRQVINISSGAAGFPYAGWSMYCGGKAALDMMTLCVALEQRTQDRPVWISAVYPGKVDTGMQASIRHADPMAFPLQDDFKKAKERGELATPESVARLIIDLYQLGQYENGGIYDLRSATYAEGNYSIDPIRRIPVLE